jgi:hypothetical protein
MRGVSLRSASHDRAEQKLFTRLRRNICALLSRETTKPALTQALKNKTFFET